MSASKVLDTVAASPWARWGTAGRADAQIELKEHDTWIELLVGRWLPGVQSQISVSRSMDTG